MNPSTVLMATRRCSCWCTAPRRVFTTTSTSRKKQSPVASSSSRPTTIPHPILDISYILARPDAVKKNLTDRKYPLDPRVVDEVCRLELEAVGLRKEIQLARERRNAAASSAKAAGEGGKARLWSREEGAAVKALLKDLEPRLATIQKSLDDLAIKLPNTSHPSSPIGAEDKAQIVRTFGPAIPSSPQPPADPARDHITLSAPTNLSWTDFPSASLVSGASWPFLLNGGALLELALTNYAFGIAINRGFSPVLTPDVIRSDVAERCGFRPRDGEAQQTYFLGDGESAGQNALCLAGTAEVPLVGMAAATTFKESELPLKRVALGRAFRAEAGARGADSRGLYRVHQFSKVEMVVIASEEQSGKVLQELRSVQEEILGSLGLSLRVLEMPTEELGASAHRKYDIEAWMPGRGKWGELSSASNCTDYQSRRLGIKYRPKAPPAPIENTLEDISIPTPAALESTAGHPQLSSSSSGPPRTTYAHTLNATAAAIPRLIVALLENGAVFDADGKVEHVRLPEVLRRFWIGDEKTIEWVKNGEALRQP